MADPSTAIPPGVVFELPPEVVEPFHHIQLTKYLYVAASIVMFYDILITFDLEVARVWKTRSSLGKYLFIFNRYLPPLLFIFDLVFQLLPLPSVELEHLAEDPLTVRYSCKKSFLPSTVLGIIALGAVEFVLVLRTYALFHYQWLLWVLSILCAGSTATMATTTIKLFKDNITWIEPGVLPLPGCTPNCTDPICKTMLTVFWIPFFVLETIIVVLTVYKSYISYAAIGANKSPFVTIIYRDGLLYYFVIVSISVTNLIVWVAAPISLAYLATSMMRSLQVTISSRLLLNIRGMLDRGYATTHGGTLTDVVTEIKYGSNPKMGKTMGSGYTGSTTQFSTVNRDGSYAGALRDTEEDNW